MKVFETLKPVDSNEIANLIAAGKSGEIVERMKAYETQQALIKSGAVKLKRVCVKTNKSEGLYVQHPAILNSTNGMNFNRLLCPAVEAIVNDDVLLELVRDYFNEGKSTEYHFIIE